jgi:hypothetical protein
MSHTQLECILTAAAAAALVCILLCMMKKKKKTTPTKASRLSRSDDVTDCLHQCDKDAEDAIAKCDDNDYTCQGQVGQNLTACNSRCVQQHSASAVSSLLSRRRS